MAAKRPPGVAFTAGFDGFVDHPAFLVPVTNLMGFATADDLEAPPPPAAAFFFGAFRRVASQAALDASNRAENNSSDSNQPRLAS